ncbi:MAG TPA: CxxxxCH/CxxCH domain-containing protein, partial [Polyangia bacterium]
AAPAPTPMRADLTFGGRATLGGVAARYGYDTLSCTAYCHGVTLSGGSNTAPVWNRVGAGEAACGTCHGLPPAAPHPQSTACQSCHPTVLGDGTLDKDLHINGVVDLRGGTGTCTSCHGSAANPAPPVDTQGRADTTLVSVGAHQTHLTEGPLTRALPCESCHVVPTDVGHSNGVVDLAWSALASADGATPAWDRASGTCTTYCHGQTLAGGANTTPEWTKVDGTQAACGACHGLPPAAPHPQSSACATCHPTVDASMAIIDKDLHVNGQVDVSVACNSCHGSAANPAPPVDTHGRSDVALRSVGAHQAHLTAGPVARALPCAECHLVPTTTAHIDGTPQVTFGPLSRADGATPTWNGTSCNAYCHGQTITGGSLKQPQWTTVDGSQAACGTCHSLPPGGGHPAQATTANCYGCHGAVVAAGLAWVNKDLHVDGQVQNTHTAKRGAYWHLPGAPSACKACHGATLHGGIGRSCYLCHGAPDHTSSRSGVLHKSSGTCSACHDGSFAPACSSCH